MPSNTPFFTKCGARPRTTEKAKIHPEYVEATVHCACGTEWQTKATRPQLRVEVCSRCHPFFTGEQRIVDTAGRVERFNRRFQRPT
jgi:large subunit ribosomal protein L31